jgi:hypothetical protein
VSCPGVEILGNETWWQVPEPGILFVTVTETHEDGITAASRRGGALDAPPRETDTSTSRLDARGPSIPRLLDRHQAAHNLTKFTDTVHKNGPAAAGVCPTTELHAAFG